MKLEKLRTIAVLRELDDDALARLAAVIEEQGYADGQTISAEGDSGDAMFFIVSGNVWIEKKTGGGTASQKTLAILEAGDYFGEIALFDQQPRSASAVASGPTQTLRLSKTAFDTLPKEGSRAGVSMLFAMIRTSGERIRLLNAHIVVYDEIGKAIGESRNLDREEPFKSCARLGFETAALLLAPILIDGQVLGLIVLGGQQSGQFDLNELNLARGVARQAAQAILNARHREEDQARARHAKQFVRF